MTPTVRFRRLQHAGALPPPAYETPGAAGMDIRAGLLGGPMRLNPGKILAVPTGMEIEIPAGYEGQVRPRSGLALRHAIGIANAPGTIDSDYRGELMVLLINHGEDSFLIEHGDRIAQLVITSVVQAVIAATDELSETLRGSKGFGSTGVK